MKRILSRYGDSLKYKLIMQTYDGAAIMSGHLTGLQTLIRQDYPYERFSDAESFSFVDLVNPKIFNQWKNAVPSDKILLLKEKYRSFFDIPKLQSQLQFECQDQDFFKETLTELLHHIFSVNMQDCVPEFVNLLKLNAVMAVSGASAERCFSCLGGVKSNLRN